jgi:glycosyltransferase involved in cell wall biosynthesis
MIDVTAIITAHSEGLLAGPALASYWAAVDAARASGIAVETLVVLDRPTDLTQRMFASSDSLGARIILNDDGDPGMTRNRGVRESSGKYVTFLDGDDLWGSQWIVLSHAFCERNGSKVIAHSEMNLVFGEQRLVWFHEDSESADFDVGYQRIANYWDAMCFSPREILASIPFEQNAIRDGYAHEDWHWNNVTLEAGFSHRPVPGTVHMKRRRVGSQMTKCDENDAIVRPTAMTSFQWRAAH